MPLYEVTFERHAYPLAPEVLEVEFSAVALNQNLDRYQNQDDLPALLVTNVYLAEDSEEGDDVRVVLGMDLLVEADSEQAAMALLVEQSVMQEMAEEVFYEVLPDLEFENDLEWVAIKAEDSYMTKTAAGAFVLEIPPLRRHPAWACSVVKGKSGKSAGSTSEGDLIRADNLAMSLEKAFFLFEEQCKIRLQT